MNKAIIIFLFLLFYFTSVSLAYEATEVKNGGSIEGVVTFAGPNIPKDETLTISSDVKYCGKSLSAEKYLITLDRKIKNVVVCITNIKAGKPIPRVDVIVENLKCAFVPHVSMGFVGNNFTTKNSDPMFHNVHVYLNEKTLYNIGLPQQGSVVSKPLKKTGIVEITCDAHPWMHAYAYIFDHPYATVSNEKGEFLIKDIPPGVYSIEAWHEALGKVKLENVKIDPGKSSNVKLEYK
jgi:hypothetical protein